MQEEERTSPPSPHPLSLTMSVACMDSPPFQYVLPHRGCRFGGHFTVQQLTFTKKETESQECDRSPASSHSWKVKEPDLEHSGR